MWGAQFLGFEGFDIKCKIIGTVSFSVKFKYIVLVDNRKDVVKPLKVLIPYVKNVYMD